MDATYTFRIGLSSSRPIREDRQRWITIIGEDSHAGMLGAQRAAIAMAMGSTECAMATSAELLLAEI